MENCKYKTVKYCYFTKGNYYKLFILLITIHCSLFTALSQDIHFTQFNNSPLTLNPASTGIFFGDYRLCLNDRNQWRSVTKPFTTLSASFDSKILTNTFKKNMLSAGIVFFRDKAGDSDFGTTEASLSVNYTKSIDVFAKQYISFGIQAGMAQRTLDFSNLTFDNQYNGYKYDSDLSNLQQFNKDNFMFPDLSAGLNWYYFIKERTNLNAGVSVFHINQPDQSIIADGKSKLAPRLSFNLNFQTPIAEKLDIEPSALFMRQGTFNEFNFGLMLRIIKDRNVYNYTSFNIGAFTRLKDAANIMAGVDYKRFTIGLSYDINYSDLHKASYSRGAYEISLIYRIFKTSKLSVLPHCRII